MSILKNAQFLKIALAVHSSRRRKAMVGNIIQIGGDFRCREAQTKVRRPSLRCSSWPTYG
jgi:hypothetical protein